MGRIIDADKLKKDVLDLPNCYNGFSDTYDKACIIGVIDEQPTIEERKKAEWNYYYRKTTEDTFVCNGCGSCFVVIQGADKMNYCPNCGSEMRGESDGKVEDK